MKIAATIALSATGNGLANSISAAPDAAEAATAGRNGGRGAVGAKPSRRADASAPVRGAGGTW